jgi:dolichol kinase
MGNGFPCSSPFHHFNLLNKPLFPLKIRIKISGSGHSLGLVYYAISWTVLALISSTTMDYSCGHSAMSYGDGMASLIGIKYGKTKYNLSGDTKSLEGSLTMFIILIVTLWIVLTYYAVPADPLVICSVHW